MSTFRFRPSEQIELTFAPTTTTVNSNDHSTLGDIHLKTIGLWVDTILYEIPLLALISEAYFKFCDRDWNHHEQEKKAYQKGIKLLENGCIFSEFGSRRRRDYRTQDLVIQGLKRAAEDTSGQHNVGKLSGSSNVHFAMKYNIPPVGTVAHEWFMGIAAATNDYEGASETALRYWISCFGEGVLGIALTDTFGTPVFLKAFEQAVPRFTNAVNGVASTLPSAAASSTIPTTGSLAETKPTLSAPIAANLADSSTNPSKSPSYAQVFSGVRQDSGDPVAFVKTMREFYDSQRISDKKIIVFSDSLNIDHCLEYKKVAEDAGFQPTFGVGTFLTNDFTHVSDANKKSAPLNIVIKISTVNGRPAVKISDNIGKNTGDLDTVHEVKERLGYVEKQWKDGDEKSRWGNGNSK